jgi:hypothetical protein
MSAWHEPVERDHDFQNPTSAKKIRLAGSYMRLGTQTAVLDVACGKARPALILAQAFGCRIRGGDVGAVFIRPSSGGTSETLLPRSRDGRRVRR